MLPYTGEVLLSLFEQYNRAVWPALIAAYALGALAVALAFRPMPAGGRIVAAVLAAFWLWTGIVWHLGWFAGINFLAFGFGPVFVVQGLLLLWTGVVRGRIAFRYTPGPGAWAALALIALAVALPPLAARLEGAGWTAAAAFGVAPGPTVLFTFAMLLLARPRAPLHLAAIPLLWALAAAAMAWVLRLPGDLVLALAGVAASFLIPWMNRRRGKKA